MNIIDIHHDFDAGADAVWALLEDFGAITRWWPQGGDVAISHVDVVGNGPGMVRHIFNVGMPDPISERLDAIDPPNRTLKLSIVGVMPAGLTRYQATGSVVDAGAGRSRMSYHGEFESESGRDEESRQFLLLAYSLMFKGLAGAAAG